MNDLRSMVAAANTGQNRLTAAIDEFGLEAHREYCAVNKITVRADGAPQDREPARRRLPQHGLPWNTKASARRTCSSSASR